MSTDTNLTEIRKLTRLTLPDDDGYLFRLGIALYGFASLSSFMVELTNHLDPSVNRTELQAKTGGEILGAFRNRVKNAKKDCPDLGLIGQSAADMFETLNTERSDIVHSYPITNGAGAQILHRRVDSRGKHFEVTNEFMNEFISRLHNVSSKLYEMRRIVRPTLGD